MRADRAWSDGPRRARAGRSRRAHRARRRPPADRDPRRADCASAAGPRRTPSASDLDHPDMGAQRERSARRPLHRVMRLLRGRAVDAHAAVDHQLGRQRARLHEAREPQPLVQAQRCRSSVIAPSGPSSGVSRSRATGRRGELGSPAPAPGPAACARRRVVALFARACRRRRSQSRPAAAAPDACGTSERGGQAWSAQLQRALGRGDGRAPPAAPAARSSPHGR